METRQKRTTESVSSDTGIVGVGVAITAEDVENIVGKAVEAAVTVVKNEFIIMVNNMKDYIKELEQRIDTLEAARSAPQSDMSDLVKRIDAVAMENRRNATIANEAEQYGRRNNLRIKGLVVKRGNDCKHTVAEFVRSKLNIPMPDEAIEVAHPIPIRTSVNQDGARSSQPPVVIVRFVHREVRDSVIRQRRNLKDTPQSIVEDLTSLNLQVLNRLKNSPEVDKTWTWNGHIYATLHAGGKIKVKPFQTIDECERI